MTQVHPPIAVIGSPNSTTTFTVDILETARDRALDHAWVTFEVVERFNGRSYRKRARRARHQPADRDDTRVSTHFGQ